MLFSSVEFIVGFLPAIVALVYVAARVGGVRLAMLTVLAGSLVFYGWTYPAYVALMLASIGVNFGLGRKIAETKNKTFVALGVALNLGALAWFKYAGLFSSTLTDITQLNLTVDGVVLPLAISFFTFQQIAYLVDMLKPDRPNYSILDYALFVAFFPQLIAGPIVHHKDLTPQFRGEHFAKFRIQDIERGALLFAIGLAKKVLIADSLAPLADDVFNTAAAGGGLSTIDAWAGTLAYTFQIYFDFSGYTDMALGLAALFGVALPQNFNSPYKAKSISDFWRRWHITLSEFLRDYLYIPLGGNRGGGFKRYRNLFIVMLLGGLWHGAAWTFMVWGGLHGAYLCVNHAWNRYVGKSVTLGTVPATLITFMSVVVAWVFFRAATFEAAFSVLGAMAGLSVQSAFFVIVHFAVLPMIVFAACLSWGAPNSIEITERLLDRDTLRERWARAKAPLMSGLGAACALSLFILIVSGPYEFIYFQF